VTVGFGVSGFLAGSSTVVGSVFGGGEVVGGAGGSAIATDVSATVVLVAIPCASMSTVLFGSSNGTSDNGGTPGGTNGRRMNTAYNP
jgi:hypothetical protein